MIGALLIWAVATAPPLVVVTDSPGAPYALAIDAVAEATTETLSWDDPSIASRVAADANVTWLAVGPRSAKTLRGCRPGQCAATLVRAVDVPVGVSAVLVEVPIERQLSWIRAAFSDRKRVVVLRKSGGPVDDAAVTSVADARGVEVAFANVESAGEAVAALEAAVREHRRDTVVWLLPDPVAVNADTVGPLIQAAMAHRVPVVGFSSYFLRVGALAAIEIDIAAAATQAHALLGTGAVVRAPADAAQLRVNGRLAERLGLRVTAGEGVEVDR